MKHTLLKIAVASVALGSALAFGCGSSGCVNYIYGADGSYEPGIYVDPAPYYNGGPYTGLLPTYGLHRCAWIEGLYNYYGFYVPAHMDCWDETSAY